MIRPEQRCESTITITEIQKSNDRFVTDLNGKTIDKGSSTKEQPAIERVEISCDNCPLQPTTFQTEGQGYAAYNDANRQINQYLLNNCAKAEQYRRKGNFYYELPASFVPETIRNRTAS